jgi:hypothetical protein
VKSWLDRVLEVAVGLVVVGLLLNWAWDLLRPIVPIALVLGSLYLVIIGFLRHRREW